MPYLIRKIRGKPFYSVKNKETGKLHAVSTTKEKALAQVRLLEEVDNANKKKK